jgi:hypothetical protein
MISNKLYLTTPGALVLPGTDPATLTTLSPATRMDSVHLVIRMTLWTMGAVSIGIALILGLLAGATLSMSSAGSAISVFFGVLMTLWTMGEVRLPIFPVTDSVLTVLSWRSPVKIVKEIIIRIVVAMKGERTIWARPDESLKNQNMDPDLLRPSISVQSASPIPVVSHTAGHGLSQNLALEIASCVPPGGDGSRTRTHATPIRHFIVRIVQYRTPLFFTSHRHTITLAGLGALKCL